MKTYILLPLVLLLCSFSTSFAQRTFTGNVTEVLNGDTFIVETRLAKFTVKLQFVDAPEESQPLYTQIKDHLSRYVLNKQISFDLSTISNGVTSSRVWLNGTDLSVQMLRDGAVWYTVPDGSSQNAEERATYLESEKLAKEEKRGVWSVADIKPAYELRLARQKALKEKLDAERKKWLESALASIRYNEPTIGMPIFSFDSLCPTASGDYVTTRQSKYGMSIYKSLVWTNEREKSQCWGDFEFDESLRLVNIRRAGKVR